MNLKLAVILNLFTFMYSPLIAQYFMSGGNITHSWINGSTWKITVQSFQSCELPFGNPMLNNSGVCYDDTCNLSLSNSLGFVTSPPFSLPDGRPNGSEVLKSCSNFSTKCDSLVFINSSRAYKVTISEGIFTIPQYCGKWRFIFKPTISGMRRDTSNTNLNDGYWYFLETDINYQDTLLKNTSSVAINPFPFYAPINENLSYNLASFDIDGDSLVYHLSPTKSQLFQCNMTLPITNIPFVSPFTLSEPFATNNTFIWDSINAIISFTASVSQNPLITLVIDEYRNGIWVGNSMRDIPIVILPFTYDLPQRFELPLTYVNVNSLSVDSFSTCAGQPISFCTLLTSNSSNAIIESSNNIMTNIPGATLTYSNLLSDSVMACISWNPTISDTGWHTFTITVKDTVCPIQGVNTPQTFAYHIYVYPKPDSPISLNHQTCDSYIWNGQTYNTSGVYTSTFANVNGCDSISILNLTLNSLDTTIAQSGYSLWSNSPGAFYQWINCKDNSPIVGATNQGYTTLVGGSYAVIVNNGTCIDTSECKTTFSVNTTEYFNSNNIEIKPNPANNELFINSNIEFSSVKIYNLLSEILLESKITPTKQHVISISELKNGIYLVNINGKFVQKIVVMRD